MGLLLSPVAGAPSSEFSVGEDTDCCRQGGLRAASSLGSTIGGLVVSTLRPPDLRFGEADSRSVLGCILEPKLK